MQDALNKNRDSFMYNSQLQYCHLNHLIVGVIRHDACHQRPSGHYPSTRTLLSPQRACWPRARLPRDPVSDVPMAAAFQERETTADSNFKCGPKTNSVSIGSNLKVRSPPGKKCQLRYTVTVTSSVLLLIFFPREGTSLLDLNRLKPSYFWVRI